MMRFQIFYAVVFLFLAGNTFLTAENTLGQTRSGASQGTSLPASTVTSATSSPSTGTIIRPDQQPPDSTLKNIEWVEPQSDTAPTTGTRLEPILINGSIPATPATKPVAEPGMNMGLGMVRYPLPSAGSPVTRNGDEVLVLFQSGDSESDEALRQKTELLDTIGKNGGITIVSGNTGDTSGSNKPREIIVVGSKLRENLGSASIKKVTVRGWDPEKKEEMTPKIISNETDLALIAAEKTLDDPNINSVSINESGILMEYRSRGKIFGFIPISFTKKIELAPDSAGSEKFRVKVSFPWYRFFMNVDVTGRELSDEIAATLSNQTASTPSGGSPLTSLQVQLSKTSAMFRTLSNIMKTKHDTEKNAVRNVR